MPVGRNHPDDACIFEQVEDAAGESTPVNETHSTSKDDVLRAVPGSRRSLLIALHYPPANSPAALRSVKFVKYLTEFGWNTNVVTVRADVYGATDTALLREIPSNSRTYRAFGFDTKAVFSVRGRYPGFLAFPDRWVSWLPSAVLHAVRAIRHERSHVVISTGPPATAHCIGLLAKRMTGIPWVADFRDPWVNQHSSPMQRRLERRIAMGADRLVVTTDGLARELRARYGAAVDGKIHVVHNGYDEEDFERLPPDEASARFTIAHLGHIYAQQRDPEPFLEAIRRSLERGNLPADASVLFIGPGELALQSRFSSLVPALRLEGTVQILDSVPHHEALATMVRSSVLLLLQGSEELRVCIPSKAFEYLRSGRIVLVLAPPESETAQLMSRFDGVFMASPNDPADIAEQLAAAFRAWQSGHNDRAPHNLTRYTRRESARRLADILDDLCNR
jgi:glycosyltransferase involved in cell wall biosynthesis